MPGAQVETWDIITPEYPGDPGGVSDYCAILASALAARGYPVRIWCPDSDREKRTQPGVIVNPSLGRLRLRDLRNTGRALDALPAPRRLLVQWVPHGYGWRSMNLPFCLWLWTRSRWKGDDVSLLVHEPCLAFREGTWRQDVAAAVHRLMLVFLLGAARRVGITVPGWAPFLHPWRLGAEKAFSWLPIFSNISRHENSAAIARYRSLFPPSATVACHLGTYGGMIRPLLDEILSPLLMQEPDLHLLLLGLHSDEYCSGWKERHPTLASRVCCTGALDESELSAALQASDLALQPYPDGISSRRGSALAPLLHGVPMVTTRGYLTEAIWQESEAVLLAPSGSPRGFLQETSRLLHEPGLRPLLAQRGTDLYRKHFTVERILEKVLDFSAPPEKSALAATPHLR